MKRPAFVPLIFSLTCAAFADDLPSSAQSAVDDYARQRATTIRKLNQDLVAKLRTMKGALERARNDSGATAVQWKIDELEAEIAELTEPKTTSSLGTTPSSRSGPLYVTVYTEENYKGDHIRLKVPFEIAGPADRKDNRIINDTINSLKVPPGVEVTLFENDLRGLSMKVTTDTASLGAMRNTISSLIGKRIDANQGTAK